MCIVIRARAPLLLLRRRATPPNPRIAGHPQDEKPQSHLKHEMHAHDVIAEAQRRPGTRTEGRRGRERAEARSCIWPDLPSLPYTALNQQVDSTRLTDSTKRFVFGCGSAVGQWISVVPGPPRTLHLFSQCLSLLFSIAAPMFFHMLCEVEGR